MQLQLSDNTKTKFNRNHLNTFGLTYGLLEDGGTCVGATTGADGCCGIRVGKKRQTCYVAKITQIYKAVGPVLLKNTNMLKGKTKEEMIEVLQNTIESFIKRTPPDQLYFRLHWAGDFFSDDYTEAWVSVIKKYANVRFWAYTRSFAYVHHFVDVLNITVFLSADPENYNRAISEYSKFESSPNIGLAWMGNEPPPDRRWVVCPETSGKVKSTNSIGACAKCKLCIDRYRTKVKNISFVIH